jgi:eukaryotic-like serine/threonine-protein kinase
LKTLLLLAAIAVVSTAFLLTQPEIAATAVGSIFESSTHTVPPTLEGEVINFPVALNYTDTPTPSPTFSPEPTATETSVPTPTETPIPTPTPTLEPVEEIGQVAFVSDRSGIMQIWIINEDGTNARQISNMVEGACQPSWSPDGLQIAFISPCLRKQSQIYEEAQVYLMSADGSNVRLMPNTVLGDFDPAWSPEGDRIAFTSVRTGRPHIFVINLKDNSLQELSDTRHPDFQPTWHPGGKQLAFIRHMPFPHVWVMSDQGLTEFQFSSSGNVVDLAPVWSPDGEFILYNRSQVEPAIPWLMGKFYADRDNNREFRIPPYGIIDPGPVAGPSISPDGNWIAFESWPDGRNHDIFIMDINGENRRRLTSDPGFDFNPAWKPKRQQ